MRYLIVIFLFVMSVCAEVLAPKDTLEASGNVVNMELHKDNLIVGTDAGTLEVYNLSTKQKVFEKVFNKIKDFMGDIMSPKIFSVDYNEELQKYLVVIQKQSGARELSLVSADGHKEVLISEKQKEFIAKAKFVDANRVMFALLSNEYILLDIKSKKEIYRIHVSYSHFSDFMLDEEKAYLAGSDESGVISIVDINSGEIVKKLSGANVDNIYKVSFKNGKVLGCGQDRRGSIYDVSSGFYDRYDGNFLIYAGALSPSAKKAAFAFTEENDIVIFNTSSSAKIYTLKGQKSTLNTIIFKSENELVSGSDDKFINIWELK